MRIQRQDLARLLASTVKVVEARQTIPILATVRLVAADGKLQATATDLDIEITATAPAEGSLEACIDAKLLSGIVGKVAGDEIDIQVADSTAVIKSGRSRFTLPVLPIDDFPSFTAAGLDTAFEVDLATLFAPVQFAISTEETRFYLNGIYLHVDDGKLVAVATDGHRLARNFGQEAEAFEGIIVPRKTVGLLPKGDVAVSLSNTKIRFVSGDTVITSKLIDGTFPDYKRIIPTGNDRVVTFGSDDMVKAAGRVAVVASGREPGVKLSIDGGDLALSLREDAEAFDSIFVTFEGEPLEVGFNANYLAEVVGQFPAGDVKMALADGGSPVLFTSDKSEGLMVVLMPRRV